MSETRLNITLDVRAGNVGARRVNVRATLPVRVLLAQVKDRFNLDGAFQARAGTLLAEDVTLVGAGITDGATLAIERVARDTGVHRAIAIGDRLPFSRAVRRIYLQDPRSLIEYDVLWQPAIIGRHNHRDPATNRLLSVDLDGVEPVPTVSRHHAVLTEQDGRFFIEPLQARNPVYLADRRIVHGERTPLPSGAELRLGAVRLVFRVIG